MLNNTSQASNSVRAFVDIFYFAILIIGVIALWRVFTKAGEKGWKILIPLYNTYILLKIAGRPGWWLILYFIPIVNLIIYCIVSLDLAKAFGKSAFFGFVGLFLFSIIGYLMLGFGGASYSGPSTTTSIPAPIV